MVVLFLSLTNINAAPLDDPTRPPGYPLYRPGAGAEVNRWTVSQIVITAKHRRAVVNDRPVRVGDTVSGAKVIAILPSEVHLQKKSKRIIAPLLTVRVNKRIRVVEQ